MPQSRFVPMPVLLSDRIETSWVSIPPLATGGKTGVRGINILVEKRMQCIVLSKWGFVLVLF